MSDYISRADAIETVCRTRCGDKAKGCPAHFCLVIEEFEALPSADAVQGEWIDREHCQVDEDAYEIATCSHCKAEITLEYPNDNFCPNCGARMKGGAE